MNHSKTIAALATLLLMTGTASAVDGSIDFSPSSYNFNITASGGNYTQPVDITWTGDRDVKVYLDSNIQAEDTNDIGINTIFDKTVYNLESGETQTAQITIDTSPALKPDNFTITTKARLVIPQEVNNNYGGDDVNIIRSGNDSVINESEYQAIKDDLERLEELEQRIQDQEDKDNSSGNESTQELQDTVNQLKNNINQKSSRISALEDKVERLQRQDTNGNGFWKGVSLVSVLMLFSFLAYFRKPIYNSMTSEEEQEEE